MMWVGTKEVTLGTILENLTIEEEMNVAIVPLVNVYGRKDIVTFPANQIQDMLVAYPCIEDLEVVSLEVTSDTFGVVYFPPFSRYDDILILMEDCGEE